MGWEWSAVDRLERRKKESLGKRNKDPANFTCTKQKFLETEISRAQLTLE